LGEEPPIAAEDRGEADEHVAFQPRGYPIRTRQVALQGDASLACRLEAERPCHDAVRPVRPNHDASPVGRDRVMLSRLDLIDAAALAVHGTDVLALADLHAGLPGTIEQQRIEVSTLRQVEDGLTAGL